jgi:hypothetical protein
MLTLAAGHTAGSVTTRYLLIHTAVPLQAQLKNLYGTDPQDIRDGVLQEALHCRPSEAVEYPTGPLSSSTAGHLSRQRLDQLATERTWQPLGMHTVRFGPLSSEVAARCAPTELDQDTDTHLKGIVHDFFAPATPTVAGMPTPTPFPKQFDQDLRLPCLSGLARFRRAVFEDPEFG